MLEEFLSQMLVSDPGKKCLKALQKKYKKLTDPLNYTLIDYINSIDFVVRSMMAGKPLNEDMEDDTNADEEATADKQGDASIKNQDESGDQLAGGPSLDY